MNIFSLYIRGWGNSVVDKSFFLLKKGFDNSIVIVWPVRITAGRLVQAVQCLGVDRQGSMMHYFIIYLTSTHTLDAPG